MSKEKEVASIVTIIDRFDDAVQQISFQVGFMLAKSAASSEPSVRDALARLSNRMHKNPELPANASDYTFPA